MNTEVTGFALQSMLGNIIKYNHNEEMNRILHGVDRCGYDVLILSHQIFQKEADSNIYDLFMVSFHLL